MNRDIIKMRNTAVRKQDSIRAKILKEAAKGYKVVKGNCIGLGEVPIQRT